MKIAEIKGVPFRFDRRRLVIGISGMAVAATASQSASAKSSREASERAVAYPVTYHRTKVIDGIKIFYREARRRVRRSYCCFTGFRPRHTCSAT